MFDMRGYYVLTRFKAFESLELWVANDLGSESDLHNIDPDYGAAGRGIPPRESSLWAVIERSVSKRKGW